MATVYDLEELHDIFQTPQKRYILLEGWRGVPIGTVSWNTYRLSVPYALDFVSCRIRSWATQIAVSCSQEEMDIASAFFTDLIEELASLGERGIGMSQVVKHLPSLMDSTQDDGV